MIKGIEVRRLAQKIWDYHQLHQKLQKADCLFVLGSNDARVMEYAVQLYQKKWAPYLLISGGVGVAALLKEPWKGTIADKYAKIAVNKGIPQERIIIQNKSTNTGEDIDYMRSILKERRLNFKSFLVVQKPFMERRAYATFKKRWPGKKIIVTSPSISYRDYPNDQISEDDLINLMVGDLQRIIIYPRKGYQISQRVPEQIKKAMDRLIQLGFNKHIVNEPIEKHKEISLVVPFYNGGKQILITYEKLSKYLKKNFFDYQLIFVNDGSIDKTLELLEKKTKGDKRLSLVSYKTNRGRGYAVRKGFTKATKSIIGYIDSDLEIPPKYIESCYRHLGVSDAVIVSKNHSQSQIDAPLKRKISSRVFNSWARLVLDSKVKDHQAGLKLFKRNKILNLARKIKSDRWLFDVELLYLIQKRGIQITEVPIKIKYGYGKIGKSFFVDFVKMFFWVLRLRFFDNTILK